VLLMTRQGDSFLDAGLRGYLGITLGNGSNIYDCVSVHGDLTNIARIGAQSYCSVFHQALTQETSRLLYLATQGYNPDMGIGVWRRPVDGGTHNPRGAQFAFLSGRPYRWNHVDLRTNVQTIVERLFGVGSDVAEGATPRVRLDLRAPSPALGTAAVGFSLPLSAETWLRVYDTQGRAVRTLFQGRLGAGHHSRPWDGRDGAGVAVSAGVYYLRLDAGERGLTRPVLLVR